MSPTYITAVLLLVGAILKAFHVEVAPEALQTTVLTTLSIVGPLFIGLRHWAKGNTTLVGTRPAK